MQTRALIGLSIALLIESAIGCKQKEGALADLAELHGAAERDFAANPEKWGRAAVGETFRVGDALRTTDASDAYVRLTRGGGLKLGPRSLVRFRMPSRESKQAFGIESGDAEIESGSDGLAIDTQLGEAFIEAGGRVKIRNAGDRTVFEIIVGQTVLEGDGGAAMRLGPGEKLTVAIGGAISDHTRPSAGFGAAGLAPDGGGAEHAGSENGAGSWGMIVRGSVEGDGAEVQRRNEAWAPLRAGDVDVAAGSRVRLRAGTTLTVVRRGERASIRGAADVVVGTPDEPLLNAVEGDLALEGADGVVQIDVPGGAIVVRQGGRAGVSVRRGRATEVKAERGEIEVRAKDGRSLLGAGQSTMIPRGEDLAAGQSTRPRGEEPAVEQAPAVPADFSILAGESSVVHDPNAPSGVRILFSNICAGEGEVEFSTPKNKAIRARGQGSATLLARPGVHGYRVRCLDDNGAGNVRSEGKISVVTDSGAAQLPRRPPHNTIDSDGRRYTVLYQSLLPQLTIDWPHAPAAKSFVLHLAPQRGASRRIDAAKASVDFSSGQVGEGMYDFWFEIPGDDAHRSPKTTLRIDFDNAAPAAHIQEPPGGVSIAGPVTVAGVAIEGARVSVNGVDLALDAQYRFRDQASAKEGEGSLAIRIAHPRHGVHYYLRRSKKVGP